MDTLVEHFLLRVGQQFAVGILHGSGRLGIEGRLDLALTQRPHVGEAHAVGREHTGEGVQEHAGHAEGIGHQAGVLPTGTAEAVEGVLGDIVAALHGDLLDGVRSEEHTSELQSLMRISYAVFCLKKKKNKSKQLERLPYLTTKQINYDNAKQTHRYTCDNI